MYVLEALIADEALIWKALPLYGAVVRLSQGKAMIPFSKWMREFYDIPRFPFTEGEPQLIPESIVSIAAPIAKAGRVAYIEANFFGGDGTQACVVWDSGGEILRLFKEPKAINAALRLLGVEVRDAHDEFDALDLGRHRDTERWKAIWTSTPP